MASSGAVTTYEHDQLGQRTSQTADGVASTFGYDQAGRLTSYDGVATYRYDGDWLRQSKTVGGATLQMTWSDGGLPMLLDDSEHAFIYGPGGIPLAQVNDAGTFRYLHGDQLGSIRLVTNATGAPVGSATYSAYGVPTTQGTRSKLGYAGEYTDSESGLVYLRARYYDPATGQFLTRDPIEDFTGDPYGYANGNPLLYTDPTGLFGWKDVRTGLRVTATVAAGAALVAGAVAASPVVVTGLAVTAASAAAGAACLSWTHGDKEGAVWDAADTTRAGRGVTLILPLAMVDPEEQRERYRWHAPCERQQPTKPPPYSSPGSPEVFDPWA